MKYQSVGTKPPYEQKATKGYKWVNIGAFKRRRGSSIAEAYMPKDSSKTTLIRLEPSFYSPDIGERKAMYFNYNDSLIPRLERVLAKYKEWTKIAQENFTGEFGKKIEVVTDFAGYDEDNPGSILYRYWFPKTEDKKFVFRVMENAKHPLMGIGIDNYDDKFIPRYCTLFFDNIKDFEDFINFLRWENIEKRIKTSTVDQLFK